MLILAQRSEISRICREVHRLEGCTFISIACRRSSCPSRRLQEMPCTYLSAMSSAHQQRPVVSADCGHATPGSCKLCPGLPDLLHAWPRPSVHQPQPRLQIRAQPRASNSAPQLAEAGLQIAISESCSGASLLLDLLVAQCLSAAIKGLALDSLTFQGFCLLLTGPGRGLGSRCTLLCSSKGSICLWVPWQANCHSVWPGWHVNRLLRQGPVSTSE